MERDNSGDGDLRTPSGRSQSNPTSGSQSKSRNYEMLSNAFQNVNLEKRERRERVTSGSKEHVATSVPAAAAEDFPEDGYASQLPVPEQNDRAVASMPLALDRSLHDSDEESGVGSPSSSLPLDEQCTSPPESPPTPKVTKMCSQVFFRQPSQTLIFLDWDDTLFPTSHLFKVWKIPGNPSFWADAGISKEQEASLQVWVQALLLFLETASKLSEGCVVITNSSRPWVMQCLRQFAPNLLDYFCEPSCSEGKRSADARAQGSGGYVGETTVNKVNDASTPYVRVVYAVETLLVRKRNNLARGSPAKHVDEGPSAEDLVDMLTASKFSAMTREAKRFYSQYKDQTWKNILSIGDAMYEFDAVHDMCIRRKSPKHKTEVIRVKALVAPAAPTVDSLTHWLRIMSVLLEVFVRFDGDIDVDMNEATWIDQIAGELEVPDLTTMLQGPLDQDAMDDIAQLIEDHPMFHS